MEPEIKRNDLVWFDPYASIRTDGYILLAALLGQPPSEELIKILQDLKWSVAIPEKLDQALQMLSQAGRHYPLAILEEEFDKLFVGLGSGGMVPYASWYKEKRIQSRPLVYLRSDLIRLGIVRQTESLESEDHAAFLCEIMALISQNSMDVPLKDQADFFQKHILWWMPNFFQDLQKAKGADFYRKVGLFGRCFFESEDQYLKVFAPADSGNK